MSKRVLIISPYFPPSNTADMQRVRMSLPYFKQYDWEAEVVTVDPAYSDLPKDELLIQTIPDDTKIHLVKALSKRWTEKFGFGNIAFRSYWFYRKKVDVLLKAKKFDLICFSTTQFPICVLGPYWKKKHGIPYVIDMQDAWYSNYYADKPKQQQPPKYKLAYGLHKYLERIAMTQVNGLISVSEKYIVDLKNRYSQIKHIPSATITFGGFEPDFEIAQENKDTFANLLDPGFKNIVYIGRGGIDMHNAISPVFKALKNALNAEPELFKQLKFYFIGTSYAPAGQEIPTIMPLAKQFGVKDNVIEIPGRISYFHTLATLGNADALFIPGSDDPKYTASKIYPYLLAKKPMLAIFNSKSPALDVLNECGAKYAYSYDAPDIEACLVKFFSAIINNTITQPNYNKHCIEKYSAKNIANKQCDLFNLVLNKA